MSGSRGENTGGLMSSAGLVRYFDAEDSNAIQMDPRTVIVIAVSLGLFVHLLGIMVYGVRIA